MLSITLSSKGQITLPSEIRTHLGLHAGDRLIAVEVDGAVILRSVSHKGFLDSCAALAPATKGKPVSVKAMKETIAQGALERFAKAVKR